MTHEVTPHEVRCKIIETTRKIHYVQACHMLNGYTYQRIALLSLLLSFPDQDANSVRFSRRMRELLNA